MDNFENFENVIDSVLKKLKEKDYISIFFLLMDFISPDEYFDIMNMDRSQKEKTLKKVLKLTREEEQTLFQILIILQKNNLLRLFNKCKHTIKKTDSFDKISPLWKVMYDVCESVRPTTDLTALKQLLPEVESCQKTEFIFIHAYEAEIFSDFNLENLAEIFRNERPDISAILDKYNGKVCNIKYYPIRTPTRGSPCGLAIIVGHKYFWDEDGEENSDLQSREDSTKDAAALNEVFEMFGFKTEIYYDLEDWEVINLFKQIARRDHSSYDIFVTCYMSHGADGVVYASNSKPVVISYLEDIIANTCSTLLDKPKLFFIQACQGSQIQKGVSSQPVKLPMNVLYSKTMIESNTPLYSDVLKVISSIPGYASFAVPGDMCWFIQSLVSKMKKYGKYLDLNDIVVKVQDEVSNRKGTVSLPNDEIVTNCKQTVVYQSTLRRKLKLKLRQD